MADVTINAEELQQAATDLKRTVKEFSQSVNTLDESLSAAMQFADTFVTRLEGVVSGLERSL